VADQAADPAFVICGIEHSGTTLLSDVFRQVPGLGSGFETGVLLADSPASFRSLPVFAAEFGKNWGLGEADIAFICGAADFPAFYRRLAQRSGVLAPGVTRIFDKTPRYMLALGACLARSPAPFIVTFKDPRAVLHSAWSRAGRPPFMAWLDSVEAETLGYLGALYAQYRRERGNPRVLFLPLEALCLSAGESCARAFAHVGVAWDTGYLVLRETQYAPTYGRTIQVGQPFAYRREWAGEAMRAVETRFAALADWFHG
jgi:hypothetical protein